MSLSDANPNRLVLRGLEAVLACIEHHPKSIREIHATPTFVPALSPHIIKLEALGVKFRTSSIDDLSHLAEAHCEDVCALTFRPDPGHVRISDFNEWRENHETVVIADRVTRPADLAAIARAMSAFGIQRLLLSSTTTQLTFNPEVWHLAGGAMEHVRIMHAAALGGLLKLVKEKCCVVSLSPAVGRKIDLGTPVRVPGRHLALLLSGTEIDADLLPRIEHCYRFPGLTSRPALDLASAAPIGMAWIASTPKPRVDGFLARKRARHAKSDDTTPTA